MVGHDIAFPVAIAPTAMLRMAHPDGEVAAAKGFRFHLLSIIVIK